MKRKLNLRFLALLLVSVLVLGVAVHFVHAFQVKRNVRALFEQAEQAEKEGNVAATLLHLKDYLGFEPEDNDALAKYGLLLDDQAQEQKSLRGRDYAFYILEQVVRRDPERKDVRRRLVDIAMDLWKLSAAREHLGKLIAASPSDGKLEALLALCEERGQDFPKAAEWYRQATQDTPTNLDNYVRLATIYRRRLEQPKKADETMDGMVKANPQSARAWVLRARYRMEVAPGKPSVLAEVGKDVAEAQKLAPNDPDVLLVSAQLAQTQGKPNKARRLLQQGLKLHPTQDQQVQMYLRLIDFAIKDSNPPEALAIVQRALKELPNQSDLLFSWANLLIGQGKTQEAKEPISQLRKAGYAPTLVDLLEARLLMITGEWGESVPLLEHILLPKLAASPELAFQANLMLGQCQEHLDNPDQALIAYRQAILLKPLSVEARLGWANSLVVLGRLNEAVAEYRQILALNNAPPAARLALVRVLILRNLRLPAKERDWKEIDSQLDLTAKALPDAPETVILKAEVLVRKDPGQLAEARKLIEQARDRSPDKAAYWITLADLAGAEGKIDKALALLDQAQRRPKLRDQVALRWARIRQLARHPAAEARKSLAAIEQDLDKATPVDQQILMQGLAGTYFAIGSEADAERLWHHLAEILPHNLQIRLWLFDLAMQHGQEADMERLQTEIRRIEGEEGVLWRYAEASRLSRQAVGDKISDPERKKLLGEARQRLAEVAKRRPSWARVPALEGEIEVVNQNPDRAIASFQQALSLGDRRPLIVRQLVQLLIENHRFAEAEQAVRKLLDQDQLLLSAGLGKLSAEISLRNQDQQRALEFATKVVPLNSKNYLDHLWLAHLYWDLKKPAAAEKELQRARQLGADKPETWVAIVSFLVSTDQKKKAEATLEQARKSLPPDQAPVALGLCFEFLQKLDLAEKEFLAALQSKPNDIAALHNVAAFYLRTLELQKAKPYLEKLLDPETKSPAAELAWVRRSLAPVLAFSGDYGQFRRAVDLMDQNLQASTDPETDKRVKALVLATRERDRKKAISLFEEVSAHQTLTANEQFALVQLYDADGNWLRAQSRMLRLLRSPEGNKSWFQVYYIRLLLKHKPPDLDAADFWLKKLEETAPQAPRTQEIKARVLHAKGQDAEAVALLEDYARGKDVDLGGVALLLDQLSQTGPAGDLYRQHAEAMYRRYVDQARKPGRLLFLADFLGRQKRVEEALDCCQEALPHAPEAVLTVAERVLKAGPVSVDQLRRVERWLNEELMRNPRSIALLYVLADLRNFQGRYQDTMAVYRQILQNNDRDLLALNNLAWLLAFQEKKGEEALLQINRAIKITGPSPELLDTRAVISLTMGQRDAALTDLQSAIDATPTAIEYFHLAQAYAMGHQHHEAIAALRKAKAAGFNAESLHSLERPAYRQLLDELGLE